MSLALMWCPLCARPYWRDPATGPASPCCFIRQGTGHRAGLLTSIEFELLRKDESRV